MEDNDLNSKFSSFPNSFMVDAFLFVAALITLIVMMIVFYVACGHSVVHNSFAVVIF